MPSEPQDDQLDSTKSFRMLSPGILISHYKIIEKIGSGGMGVVYKAEDTRLGRTVALKFLPSHLLCDVEAKARFEHEAKAASALNHNNITTVYDIDEEKGQCFICMEYVGGKSIKELIKGRTLSLDKVPDIAIQIAEGLNAAHKKDIVHRDVKSDNIMLTDDGVVKIMDFGLAKLKGVTKLTKTGTTLGTMQYMSPEQAQGIEVDHRSDIFSFGVVLYEMITGQIPFQGEHEAAIIYSIVNETPEPLARYKVNVPEGLQRIVDKALQKDVSTRYQSAAEAIADLKGLQKDMTVGVFAKPKKKLLPFVIPASIVFVVLLLFLILKPFQVELVPEKAAIAEENSLAIMYFENMVDPEDKDRFAQMITALLITDLSESQYMRVVSRQRLYDILKLLGNEDLKVIDKTVASEVASRAGVKWLLTGSILQTEPSIVLTSDISEAETGGMLATQRITGEEGEDLFTVVDRLSAEIKEDLSLPEAAKKELDRPVADVTTHSQEAYRYYLEGLDYGWKYYFTDAERSFEKALKFDTTFAMAYYRLAALRSGEERRRLTAKAVTYSDKASHKERDFIRSWEAYESGDYVRAVTELKKLIERYPHDKELFYLVGYICRHKLRKYEEAVHYFNKAIGIDPLDKVVYNALAYVYDDMGNFDKSIWAINKYISLAPDEANPYDSRGDLYARNGKLDQAIESYNKALEIKPDFYLSLRKLGDMYLFKREYAKAESCYQELCSSSNEGWRPDGRMYLAYLPIYQGKFNQALEVLDDGLAADRMERVEGRQNALKHLLKAHIYKEKRNLNSALKEAEKGMEIRHRVYPDDPSYDRSDYAYLLIENNDFEKAEEVAEALKKDIEEKDQIWMSDYWWTVGYIELARGNFESSVTNFEKAARDVPYIWAHYPLAKAYLEAGRLGEAVAEFERVLSRYDENRAFNAIWAVKAHYLLGLAYERSGWNKKAIEQYEEFLEIWKDADPGIPEVEDAKERSAKLKATS